MLQVHAVHADGWVAQRTLFFFLFLLLIHAGVCLNTIPGMECVPCACCITLGSFSRMRPLSVFPYVKISGPLVNCEHDDESICSNV